MFKRYLGLGAVVVWAVVFMVPGVAVANATIDGIKDINGAIFNAGRITISLVLFGVIFWEVLQGHMQKNLSSKWMTIIGSIVFVIFINAAPTIYNAMFGTNAVNKDYVVPGFGGPAPTDS